MKQLFLFDSVDPTKCQWVFNKSFNSTTPDQCGLCSWFRYGPTGSVNYVNFDNYMNGPALYVTTVRLPFSLILQVELRQRGG